MDRTTELLSAYACRLNYHDLDPRVVHQVKRTMVDTLGCAMGGYLSEPAKIARAWRRRSPAPHHPGCWEPT